MRLILASLAVLALTSPALAQQTPAAPDCSKPAPLTSELTGWSAKAPITSATGEATLSSAALTIGKSHEATLLKTPQVAYILQPEKPGGSVSNGGLFSFNAETGGTYRIALSTAAWIDLIEDGRLGRDDVHGEWPDIVGGRVPGRRTETEVVLYVALGIWGEYAAILPQVYRNALSLGMGRPVPD